MTARPAFEAPRHLRAATRAWVEAVVRDYELEPHHLRLLQLAGESWDRCQQAREALVREGITFRDRHGAIRPHPGVAMERLRKKDADAGVTQATVTDEQKAEIAEVRNRAEARIAELKILHQSKVAAIFDPEARALIDAELRRDIERIEDDREMKIAGIRGASAG